MAIASSSALWISPESDPTLATGFRCNTETSTPQLVQRIGQYGTRLRAVTSTVTAQQLPVTLFCDTRDQVTFLETWQGETVCVRDPRGRKFYATYTDLSLPEQYSPNVRLQVTLTFNEVTSQYGAPV